MRGLTLFCAGLLVGGAIQMAVAQNQNRGITGVNHVGISVPDMDAAVAYYTETLGFPEAFRRTNDAGQPTLVYIQVSRDTFIELNRANGRPAGLNHVGIEVENVKDAAALFSARGAKVSDVRSGSTQSYLADITSLNGVRLELSEYPPGSDQRAAIDGWR